MRIIILTSQDHIYANYIIKNLLFKDFKDGEFLIIESNTLLPNKSKLESLFRYLKISGFYYFFSQVFKVYFFKALWFVGKVFSFKNVESKFFYWKNNINADFKMEQTNNINSEEVFCKIKEFNPDIILSVFFNQIVGEKIINLMKDEICNIHPSLLPFYKGVSPTFWALTEKEKYSGITLHRISKNIDEGEIISQEKIEIKDSDSEHLLYVKSVKKAYGLIRYFLKEGKKEVLLKGSDTNGFYRSIPDRKAVQKFKKHKKKFFRFSELINSFEKIK